MARLSLLSLFAGKRRAGMDLEVERNTTLRIYLDDTQCVCVVLDNEGGESSRRGRQIDEGEEGGADLLAATIEDLPEDLSRRVREVQVFVDDPEISVLDSRQAKLSHFEGRALAEFGKYQLGGKPVCFASHRFGATGAHESEKRAVAYISEDRLAGILFGLGKLARLATFVGPWSQQPLLAGETEDGHAHVCVHREFTTLTLANRSAGALAVRQLAFGTRTLAAAYARTFDIPEVESSAALARRDRLGPGDLHESDPAFHTSTRHALREPLASFAQEIRATLDYFEFQRLAGRASTLSLSIPANAVCGFARWLGETLETETRQIHDQTAMPVGPAPALNLLEGMRSGLLKIGAQEFDFVAGQFTPSRSPGTDTKLSASKATLAKWKAMSSQPVTRDSLLALAKPASAFALVSLALAGGFLYLPALGRNQNGDPLSRYNSAVIALDQGRLPKAKAGEAVLWSKDLLAVARAMPYEMKLKHAILTPGANNTPASFEVIGTLPRDGDHNLELIGEFLARLKALPALRGRFGDVNFAGLGDGDEKEGSETTFKITAQLRPAAP